MKKETYKKRVIDEKLSNYLLIFGAVCIEGPKWCGKTWTSLEHCGSQIFLGDPVNNFQNRKLAELDPNIILDGDMPRLIDEWQEVPPIWDAIRHKVDQNNTKGQFILTGSATPNHKGILHSGTGRIAKIMMRPMSLYESGDSNGEVSLQSLFENKLQPIIITKTSLEKLIYLTIRGGWPASLNVNEKLVAELPKEYIKAVIEEDVYKIDGVNRSPKKVELLLRSLARNESTTATNRTLAKDVSGNNSEEINPDTISEYLNVLNRLFILDNLPAFSSNIRSSTRIKTLEKRHFIDPSLACALLGATAKMLLEDLETFGLMFEALCTRDLKIYAESFNAKVYHYQDYNGKEIDVVIELEDGRWGAFEIKLGANQIDEAAKNLIAIKNIIRKGNGKEPMVLCIICGMIDAAYQREDGVFVIPITGLKN